MLSWLFVLAMGNFPDDKVKYCAEFTKHQPTGMFVWRNRCDKKIDIIYDRYGNAPNERGEYCDAARADIVTLLPGTMSSIGDRWNICAVRYSQSSRDSAVGAAKSYLGVGVTPVTPEIALALSVAAGTGEIVTAVGPDSPAQRADIREGDIIVAVNYNAITPTLSVADLISSITPGTFARIEILRRGKPIPFVVEIAARPSDEELEAASGAEAPNLPPRPKSDPARWISMDLLVGAAMGRKVAASKYDLSVDKEGRVTECTVAHSAGNSHFEGTVCRKLRGRGLFLPATDATGQASAGTYRHSISGISAVSDGGW